CGGGQRWPGARRRLPGGVSPFRSWSSGGLSAAWRKGPTAPNRTGGGRWKETAFFREGGDDCLARHIGYTRLGPLLILALAGLYHPAAWPGLIPVAGGKKSPRQGRGTGHAAPPGAGGAGGSGCRAVGLDRRLGHATVRLALLVRQGAVRLAVA